MKTFTAVFLLYLAVQDCSAAAVDPGTCRAEDIIVTPAKGFCLILPSENKCILPFSANITVGPPTCTCECDLKLNEKPVEMCCDTKTVGDYSYTKVSVGEVLPSCLNNCIYTRDDKPGSKYCFARGEQEVHCLDSSDGANGTANIAETPYTQLTTDANAEGESCRIVANRQGGVDMFNFNDKIASSNGNITQIAFRTGDWMNQIQASYGSIQSPPHGGAGGGPAGPYVLEGQPIVKVEGTTRIFRSRRYIQSLTFTDKSQRVHQFGTTENAEGFSKFRSDPGNNCYLRYLSGSTSGKYSNDRSSALVVITFNWCCP